MFSSTRVIWKRALACYRQSRKVTISRLLGISHVVHTGATLYFTSTPTLKGDEYCAREEIDVKTSSFVLLTDRQPRSLNAKGSGDYVGYVSQVASKEMANRPKLTGSLVAQIVWFHRSRTVTDADNIAKRHIDGLRGVVFVDDGAIRKCMTERVSLRQSFVLDATSLETGDLTRLLEMIAAEDSEHIVFTRITQVQGSNVQLGPAEE
jgi:hypothetical protein